MAAIEVVECDGKDHKIGRFTGKGSGRGKSWGLAIDLAHYAAFDDIRENKLPEIRCICGVEPGLTWWLVKQDRSNEKVHILVLGKDVKTTEYSLTVEETYDVEATCIRREVVPKGGKVDA
jgi:hypothetical protein